MAWPRQRRAALALLTAAVAGAHVWLTHRVAESELGGGPAARVPMRIEVAFVRELQQQAPPAAVAAPPPVRARSLAVPAASAASGPAPMQSAPPLQEPLPAPLEVPQLTTVVDPGPVTAVAAAPAAAASAPVFEWPPSTRLSYTLTGHYRGPVEGQAQVEWLRQGSRYQVHLDVGIGPAFAPLVTRRMSSDGELGDRGLRPRRYDEETRVPLRAPRAVTLWFDDDRVRLANGQAVPRPEGVQDTASQFVQMTWMFTLDPSRLQAGRTVEIPLALPRRVEAWVYDVLEPETLDTPAGPVQAVRIRPRREAKAGGDLTAELWVAPSLMYLPVRIVIRQDAENFIDLLIKRLPQQADPEPPPAITNR